MQKLKKTLLALLFLSFIGLNLQITASAEKPQKSWFGRSTQFVCDHTSKAVDATLALSTVWCAVGAVGAYRLSEISKETIPWAFKKIAEYANPGLEMEQAMQAEIIILCFAGGSLSALSLLLLKKLSWEKKQTQSNSIEC